MNESDCAQDLMNYCKKIINSDIPKSYAAYGVGIIHFMKIMNMTKEDLFYDLEKSIELGFD